jgi:acetyl-CoA carboxylase biotin carboxylase subunit
MTPELRARMGEAAVAAARAVGYRSAGTIEFLLEDGEFFFLEMNTRIQVEHPVTELVTGIDLVQWQLRIAAAEPLPWQQRDIGLAGHAIECRITSEDPGAGFLPSTGRIERLDVPAGPGVRWDGGISEGSDVSLYYDPLLAKLIVHGPDRAGAIARMARALTELRIIGVETSTPFHAQVMREADFRSGSIDIRYIERHPELLECGADAGLVRLAAVAAALLDERSRNRKTVQRVPGGARQDGAGWRGMGWRA